MRRPLGAIITGATILLAGCSSEGLRDLQTASNGPEEFMILPVKPLTAPQDYTALPPPTPGGANLVDPTPKADAIAALGGNPAALNAQGVPASDGALVSQAGRYGVQPGVRTTLAEADAAFRKRQGRLSRVRLFRVDRYEQSYRREALDPFEEADRFRRSGLSTPTAPPPGE